jgi:uncharacterized Zn finger protein (UPF0148 family)
MSCQYCGTELPDGALFCGECGRPVTVAQERVAAPTVVAPAAHVLAVELEDDGWDEELPAAAISGFSIADLAFSSPGETSAPGHGDDHDHELPDGTSLDEPAVVARCQQCGEPMADGDVFCGECGFVLRSVAPPAAVGGGIESAASIVVLPDLIRLREVSDEAEPSRMVGSDATTEVEPYVFGALDALVVAPQKPEEPSIDELVHETPAQAAAAIPAFDTDLDIDEEPPRFSLPMAQPLPSPRSRPIPDPFPWGNARSQDEDIEATRLIAEPAAGSRFVLQFSTGESVTVVGSGLVGRNPSMQPGEYVDQLVPIFDAGKSVSKTHLEYGQESGRFWISDRYSTNGSTIRQPDAEPRRAEPGRRYFIARGTRVDVGEQFFVVS